MLTAQEGLDTRKNMSIKSPLYYVECCYCGGSFAAAADNLPDLVQQALDHAKEMKASHESSHRNLPVTISEVIQSDMFEWEVKRLRPLNQIPKACDEYNSVSSSRPIRTSPRKDERSKVAPTQRL